MDTKTTPNVILSYSQINSMIEFFEMWFIESIRRDEEIDNIEYIVDMMDAYKKLRSSRDDVKKCEVLNAFRNNLQ